MSRFDIRRRDCLARLGTFRPGDDPAAPGPAAAPISTPAVLDMEEVFPDLARMQLANIPLSAPASFVQEFPPDPSLRPVALHPHLPPTAAGGDCVMVPCWHTAFANPRAYVDWLTGLKDKTAPDTAWYAPAAALPSSVHILCYSGFDLFDYTASDLRTAQGKCCTPEGEFPKEAMDSGICTCA
ncbi:MAG TPA: pseudouridine synthase, partial [Methanoregula sp.]|nr:pseudouridine synthase [Methanoregula sp.]